MTLREKILLAAMAPPSWEEASSSAFRRCCPPRHLPARTAPCNRPGPSPERSRRACRPSRCRTASATSSPPRCARPRATRSPFRQTGAGTRSRRRPRTPPGLVYSGYVQAGKEALAIIGGLEYGVGDTLPNTGDVIRFIGSDGVRLYSPSRNAEWTLPYSGDDI